MRKTQMTEAEWLACALPNPMLDLMGERATDRKLRLFACACCRHVWPLLPDDRSCQAVELSELTADSKVTDEERERLIASYPRKPVGFGPAPRDPAFYPLALHTTQVRYVVKAAIDLVDWDNRHLPSLSARAAYFAASQRQADSIRCIFGNPFRPISAESMWLTPLVSSLAQAAADERSLPCGEMDTARLSILADALEDAGCADVQVLSHLRSPDPHVRGCWVIDLILGRS
jgi:hypothetical protein